MATEQGTTTTPAIITAPATVTTPAIIPAPATTTVPATTTAPATEIEDEPLNTLDENKSLEPPKPGMTFSSFEELFVYYRQYGKQEGFGVTKRTVSCSSGGASKNVTVVCSRAGKPKSTKRNHLKPNPITKTECKARINATIWENGVCRLNSIVLEHNHGLNPRFYLYSRELSRGMRRKLEVNDQTGISVTKNYNTLVIEAGGHENVSFSEKDCRNYIEKARRLRLGAGDAEAMHKYFVRMQEKNSSFFYVVNLDDDAQVKSLFWADARSRAAYEEFGDVIMFDTTYLTNKYDMPFASFVGVNHHGQSILLGCGLLSNEDTETFTWLFQSWLYCMSGRAPNAIITDQDKAMQKAIENVFPNARHRWCLWHIMKKLVKKLKGYSMYESIKTALQNVVYDSLTTYEFEESWNIFIEKYNLGKNEWLCGLYDERHRWVPAFVKDTFWAGMSITMRSETMNSFFDGYVNSKTTLKQFFEQYDSILKSKVEKESQADFLSFSSWIPCITHFEIEKQFQEAYTTAKFKEFQEELTGKLYCDVSFVREDGGIAEFEVSEDVKIGEKRKKLIFMVSFNADSCDVQCKCRLFNFRGILCRHAISVLIKKQVEVVPSKYILPRWRKDLKRCHTRVKISYDDWSGNPEARQYDKLRKSFDEVAELAVGSDDKCKWVLNLLNDMKNKLKLKEVVCGSNRPTSNLADGKDGFSHVTRVWDWNTRQREY